MATGKDMVFGRPRRNVRTVNVVIVDPPEEQPSESRRTRTDHPAREGPCRPGPATRAALDHARPAARNDRVTAIRRFGVEPAAPASLRRVSAAEDVMSTCRHCGQPAGGFNDGFRTCGSCAVLLAGMPNEPEPEPVPVPVPARAQLDLDALFREEGESRLHCWKVQRLNLLRRARRERAVQPK